MLKNIHKKRYILLSVILLTLLMNLVDGVIKPPYAIKSLIKVVLFFVAPMLCYLSDREERQHLAKLFRPRKNAVLPALGLGILCFSAILGAYFLLKDRFDFSGVTRSLTGDSGITADNFVYTALYISFCNSFLEEFFFRGYAFLALKRYAGRGFAYAFSAFFFALYHVGMTIGWLEIAVFLLAFIGLLAGGLLFDYLNEKTGSLYPSWIVHMFANFGINTIGFLLFGIL